MKEHKKPQIVLIDDTSENVEILKMIIEDTTELKEQYQIHSFSDPISALEHCLNTDNHIHLILTDYHMPNLDGLELINKYVEKTNPLQRAAIIMISTEDSVEIISKAISKEIDDYFVKPFEPDIVTYRVLSSISKYKLRQEISESKKIKEILLRALIHDVATPITVIQYYCDQLKKEFESTKLDKMKEMTESIKNILSSIKEIESLEASKSHYVVGTHKLQNLVNKALSLVELQAKQKDVKLILNNHIEDNIEVKTNGDLFIHQVLVNLLINAVKFSPAGSMIELNINREAEETIVLSIRDYGIGIPGKLLNNIFKWDKATSRRGTNGEMGTGFGMPIVKKFIDSLGHDISIDSYSAEECFDKQTGTIINLSFH